MPTFSSAELFGMTIRESANDGSDFTNPSADYRRLFLGEDGQLHVKDSAGAVTDIGGGSSGIPATIVDVKGDIIAATAADTVARLAAGANDKVLVAASGESTGLKWDYAAPSCYENFLTAPVTAVNADTWYAGPTLTPAAGTYLFIGHLTMSSSFSGTTSQSAKISDGTNDYAFAQSYVPAATQVTSNTLMARITVNGSTAITLYGLSARGSSVSTILDNVTSPAGITSDKSSSLVAMRITSL